MANRASAHQPSKMSVWESRTSRGKDMHMKSRRFGIRNGAICSLVLAMVLLLVGCDGLSASPASEAEEQAPDSALAVQNKVIAEAIIEPAYWAELSFPTGGEVVEVLVQEDDLIAEGTLLVRFDASDIELAIREAEAAVSSAQAQLAEAMVGPRPQDIAEKEAQLADAEAAIAQAEARRDQLASGIQASLAGLQAEIAAAEAAQLQAREDHRDVHDDGDDRAKEDADYRLWAANQALDAAQVRLSAERGAVYARLRTAEQAVALAMAQRDAAQAELELAQVWIRPEEIAVSEAAVRQAETTLETTSARLEQFEMRAPFSGVVTKLDIEAGEITAPGQVLMVLATLDQLQVQTVDLTELDVVRVSEGQAVKVTVDGLLGVEVGGQVTDIARQAVDYQGDVTYPVTVELDKGVPGLRWGMTAVVEIEMETWSLRAVGQLLKW